LPPYSLNSSSQRKKAASGSACEKHKRWKKRCPEDCPMRRRRSIPGPLPQTVNEDQHSELRDQKDQIARLMDESIKYIDANDLEKSAKSIVKIVTCLDLNAPIESIVEPMSKSACVAFIKWNLQQIDSNSDALDEFGIDLKEELHNRLNIIEQELEGTGSEVEHQKYWKNLSEIPGLSHCHSESKDKQEIGRRISNRREENFVYEDEALEDDVEFEAQGKFKTQSQSMKGHVSISLELSSKPLQKNRGKCAGRGKVRSKYLPQACERHRLLHARCPANCPDRLKRDALRA